MLEQIRKMMAEVLKVSSADVIKTREALLAEQATEDARYAATSALNHPEGSTTPMEEAYSRAQGRVARIRKQIEKELPKVMSLMMALEVAEQRRDEAKLHREQSWSRPASEKDLNLNRAAVDWFPRLRQHGVRPDYLRRPSNETVAIISDLIIWTAKDAKFLDPKNPWRQVLGIYAGRKIDKPGKKGRNGGSVPGTPKPDRHNMGSGDYRFDEMVPAEWGMAIENLAALDPAKAEVLEPSTIKPPIDQVDVVDGGTPEPRDWNEGALHAAGAGRVIADEVIAKDAVAIAAAEARNEFGSPSGITDEAAGTTIHSRSTCRLGFRLLA